MKLDLGSLDTVNRELGGRSESLLAWALQLDQRAVVTTSFSPFSGVILHMATQLRPTLPVLWMDSGYNTPETYRYADALTRQLGLNLKIVQPRRSRAHREAVDGDIPQLGTAGFEAFTDEVKLEPFERGMAELAPKVWITGVRAEETAERAKMLPVSLNPDGLVKVAPLLGWNARQLHEYLQRHGLPNNFDYYDPTKLDDKRECGLHLAH